MEHLAVVAGVAVVACAYVWMIYKITGAPRFPWGAAAVGAVLGLALTLLIIEAGWAHVTSTHPELRRAYKVAVQTTGAKPCRGHAHLMYAALESWEEARATWTGRPPLATRCSVKIAFGLERTSWPHLCTLMEHEVWHLLGRGHEPDGVMLSWYREPSPACRAVVSK